MRTVVRHYCYDVAKPEEAKAYDAMVKELKALGLRDFGGWNGGGITGKHFCEHVRPLAGKAVDLDDRWLWDNQWNTGPTETSDKGLRLFDWHEMKWDNRDIREGYWLEQTPEMVAARADRHTCGYCGKQYTTAELPDGGFCAACLGSEYLKESELRLLRLRPVTAGFRYKAPELSDAEFAVMIPRYVEAQSTATSARAKARAASDRERVIRERDAAKANAEDKAAGLLWLLDRGWPLSNVIYYYHTRRFCFGWRTPVTGAVKSKLLDLLCEFPHDYDIKDA